MVLACGEQRVTLGLANLREQSFSWSTQSAFGQKMRPAWSVLDPSLSIVQAAPVSSVCMIRTALES